MDYIKEKSIIGYLLYFYRKQQKIDIANILYNNGEYYKKYCLNCDRCKNKTQICSFKTLKKIESGNIVKRECIYYRLSENINKKVTFNRFLYSKLDKIQSLVYNSLCENSYTKLITASETLTLEIQYFKNHLYFEELLNLYNDLITLHIKYEYPNEDMINCYLFLKDKLSDNNKKLLLMLLYKTRFGTNKIFNGWNEILIDIHKYLDDPLYFPIKIQEISSNNSLLDSYIILKKILENDENLTNYKRFILYNQIAYIEFNLYAFDDACISMNKCIEIIKISDFPSITNKKAYRQIGMIYFMMNKFEETITYLQMAKSDKDDTLGIQAVLLYKSLEKTNKINVLKEIINSIDISKLKNEVEKKITIYYKIKYAKEKLTKSTLNELEEYICDEIKPIVFVMGDLFKNIFLDELLQYTSQTSNYKKLFLYHTN